MNNGLLSVNYHMKRKVINAWCMYDWANSAFPTTVMAAVVPIFFRKIAASSLTYGQYNLATSIWGYTASFAMLLVAVLSLILGPVADYASSKKRFLAIFTIIGIFGTFSLSLTGINDWIWIVIFFIFGNIGFAVSEVFYNSILPHIAVDSEMDRISTKGYAWGYLGGGILLAVNVAMIYFFPKQTLIPSGPKIPILGMRLSFISAALWWGIFSTPIFRIVPEPLGQQRGLLGENPFHIALKRLSATFNEIRSYKQLFLFLIAYWFYNDGIGTIMKMATAYGDEIGIGTLDLIGALLVTQIVGIPCSILFGRLAKLWHAKKAILLGLGIYILISFGGYFMTRAIDFWILAFLVGLVMGGTQALSRSLFASMIPPEKSAEFFSFYNISGKFAGVAGPAIFGFVGYLFQSSRVGILSLLFFFITGGILLTRVRVERSF